ncbi:MAG: response regulator [Hydrogenophaga sp.]|uniref:response regulator n=1 Tax=Hydrogenophaga sp. TaxID=1904254 RepID=UPI003D0BE028
MKVLRDWVDRHRRYHHLDPRMIRYAATLALVCYPLFYLLRFTQSSPGYDDWALRLIAMAACLLMLLHDRWPSALKPHFHLFIWVAPIYCLPFLFVFTSLKNGGGPAAVANTLMAAFFTVLLTDRRNAMVMLVIGFTSAFAAYWVTDPHPQIPLDYVARLPVLLLVVAGAALFKHGLERAVTIRVRQRYGALAGSIAHEMRNPLAQLKQCLEGIERGLPSPTAGQSPQALTGECLDGLYSHVAQGELAVQRGLQIMAMTLEEVQARPIRPESLGLLRAGETCARAVQEYGYENATQRSHVSLRVECDFVFRADETAFLFVLFNLIRNALANPGVRVQIVVDAGRVDVRDDGPGIAAEVQARLFQPFHTQGKTGGTGLGLAYCWRVMKAFGGSISCSSYPGRPTCFRLTLPLASAAQRETERKTALAKARALFDGRRLLVVDADAGARFLTRHKLAFFGAVVDECADGEQALLLLAQQQYDLIMLDLHLPGLDGYALTERIRAGHAGIDPNLCVVAYSGEPVVVAQIKARKASMDGFVSKPSEQGALLLALCRAMERALARDTGQQPPLLAGRAVLLADDNAYIRQTVAASLRHAGVAVVEADSGHSVLSRLATMDRCDAILLDIEMPGMNGLEAARAIRASAMAWQRAPILMLSAHSGSDILEEARRAGADDFLTKPFNLATVQARLQALSFSSPPPPRELERASRLEAAANQLLDIKRLDNYRRIGVLDELVVDYLPAIERLLDSVEVAAQAGDMKACCEALHSLVGMSGELGALALHRFARKCYIPLVEQERWPDPADWVTALHTLAARTRQALDTCAASAVLAKA